MPDLTDHQKAVISHGTAIWRAEHAGRSDEAHHRMHACIAQLGDSDNTWCGLIGVWMGHAFRALNIPPVPLGAPLRDVEITGWETVGSDHVETTDEVDPTIRWAGQLFAALLAGDADNVNALFALAIDGPAWCTRMRILLNIIVTTSTQTEVRRG